jgi:hypothetical protein
MHGGGAMTPIERLLFIAGISITTLASVGLCAQIYTWRSACGALPQFRVLPPDRSLPAECR